MNEKWSLSFYTARLKAGDATQHKMHLCLYNVQNLHWFIDLCKEPLKKIVTKQFVLANLIPRLNIVVAKVPRRTLAPWVMIKIKNPPLLYLLNVKSLLLIPFHSSSTKLPKQTIKKSKNIAHVIKIHRVGGFDLNWFTNERASHETGQSCQACPRARAPVKD